MTYPVIKGWKYFLYWLTLSPKLCSELSFQWTGQTLWNKLTFEYSFFSQLHIEFLWFLGSRGLNIPTSAVPAAVGSSSLMFRWTEKGSSQKWKRIRRLRYFQIRTPYALADTRLIPFISMQCSQKVGSEVDLKKSLSSHWFFEDFCMEQT